MNPFFDFLCAVGLIILTIIVGAFGIVVMAIRILVVPFAIAAIVWAVVYISTGVNPLW